MGDEAELKLIAETAAKEAVAETFRALGVDVSDVQSIRTYQANMGWVFRFRKLSERLGSAIITTIFIIITGGIVSLIWKKIGN